MTKFFDVVKISIFSALVMACGGSGGNSSQTGNSSPGTSTYLASGRISNASNVGLAGVSLTLTGPTSTSSATDANGNFSIPQLPNGSFTITPALANYAFTPPLITFTINNANNNSLNFTGNISNYPSTAIITNYMSALHSQTITQFLSDEAALSSLLSSQGLYQSGAHYSQSKNDYVSHIQSCLNTSLAFIQQTSTTMSIDKNAINQLLLSYKSNDKSYALTYYSNVNWGGSPAVISTITTSINTDLDNMYTLIIQQIQIL